MDLRLALYDLADEHRLDANAARELHRLAGLRDEPVGLETALARGVAALAAALGGLGVVFWIAANWDSLGRFGRFALLQGFVAAMCVGAAARPRARAALALLALLGIGALFAHFGQTYQTGADPWQLFALWALLSLPLALGARSDVAWLPWTVVAMAAVSLWLYAHTGHRGPYAPHDLPAHAIGWGAAALIVAAMGEALARFSGAGVWARRCALTLAVVIVTVTALAALFSRSVAPQYGLALALLAAAAAALARRARFDVYGLSALALALNVLLVGGLARMLFEHGPGPNAAGSLFLLGIAAAALLSATVAVVLRLVRRQQASA